MTREKVIYSIERCICHVPDACRDCAYDAGHPYNECVEMLLKDVLELLKEQEPVVPDHSHSVYHCGKCGYTVGFEDIHGVLVFNKPYCANCGRKVKWNAAD